MVVAQNDQNMSDMSYNKVNSGRGSSCHGKCRGFRLNLRKFYVLRLSKRFTFFLRVFDKWKVSYGEAVQVLKKVFRRKGGFKRNNSNSSRSGLMREERIKDHVDCRVNSYMMNNSFYAEAIADCLEFIKRTSISSMDQVEDQVGHIQDINS
ncbi:hypothetical protein TanjilG_00860 [Lupinus angustifolius]|uniref:Uncharacterized protein n=1 Tax=Lupinus angustifolius TaxID=3871 RepID=A0A4P1QQR0_LUPAN|nr:hypothetical protein TanjilG_00860 [Lupinus angustifolius]